MRQPAHPALHSAGDQLGGDGGLLDKSGRRRYIPPTYFHLHQQSKKPPFPRAVSSFLHTRLSPF
jgi:hypothetical protein